MIVMLKEPSAQYSSSSFFCRDVLIKPLSVDRFLVVGCDSSGAVGSKPGDSVRVDGEVLGKFIVRTALMEVLAVGAKPLCVACGLGVEPEPSGNRILEGVKMEMRKVGLDPRSDLVVSTEKNFQTNQTGIGVAAVGIAHKRKLRIGKSKRGDNVACIGLPSVGLEVLENERKGVIADLDDLLRLLSLDFVHGIIPVGSRGILKEVEVLATESKLHVMLCENPPVNLNKSAGPSTVLIATVRKNHFEELKTLFKKPVCKIATLV